MNHCGLDLHKDSIFVCIKKQIGGELIRRETTTKTKDIRELRDFLKSHDVKKVAMESTSIYWVGIWTLLEDDFEMLLVNPHQVKQIPGRKSDVKDAEWICTLLQASLLRGSLVPNRIIRELRDFERRQVYLKRQQLRVLQQVDKLLVKCNVRLSSEISTLNSKSMLNVVRKLSLGEDRMEVLLGCIDAQIIKKRGRAALIEALDGNIRDYERMLLKQFLEEYDLLERQEKAVIEQMRRITDSYYPEEVELLKTSPGIEELAAMSIIAETGGDMSLFSTPKDLVSWAGLCPRNDESAGKIKSKRTTKGNKLLRRMLIQVAWGASRTKGSFYERKHKDLCKRMPRKKATVAIARKILVSVWYILKEKKPYQSPMRSPDLKKTKRQIAYHKRQIRELELEVCLH